MAARPSKGLHKPNEARVDRMTDDACKEFGRLVKFHRTRLGITQRELAKALGKSDGSYVAHIERGGGTSQNLRVRTMILLAQALGFELEIKFKSDGE